MRRKLIAGNWKMFLGIEEAKSLASAVVNLTDNNGPDILLCPSFILIPPVQEVVRGSHVRVGAQNLYWEEKGAYTGEISAMMLLDAGCTHVLIGHSERRQYFGETDSTVRRKTATALEKGLIPVVCVGETLEDREEGRTETVIENQISRALERFKAEEAAKVVIAYEPVWAIGTGQTATPEAAQEVHSQIRRWIKDRYDKEIADGIRILYGGSIKPDNATELFSEEDIDGGLVGGASLNADSFKAIIDAAG